MKIKFLSAFFVLSCLLLAQSAQARLKISIQDDEAGQGMLVKDSEGGDFDQKGGFRWVPRRFGESMPSSAVEGGFQPSPRAALYICRGFHNGSWHPGKLYAGHCNIAWGGREITLDHYEVLKSHAPMRWKRFKHRHGIPGNAVRGGVEKGVAMYVCRANYNGGLHPGKFYKGNCNLGWGGQEVVVSSDFEILVED